MNLFKERNNIKYKPKRSSPFLQMSNYNYESSQPFFNNQSFLFGMNQNVFSSQLQNQKIYTSNEELFHQSTNDCSFLRKRSSNNLLNYVDDDYDKENIPDNFEIGTKRNQFLCKQKKPLKEIKFNDLANKNIINNEDSFANILEMSIKEKKQIDKEERQKKKFNKLYMIKMQQKYKQNFKNDMVDY